MIRHTHKLLLAAVLSGFSAISAVSVDAGCHGRSSGGYSGGHSHVSHYSNGHGYPQPSYSSHIHSQAVYRPPVYSQPIYPQPGYAQPGYGQPQQQTQQPQLQTVPQTLQQPQMQVGAATNGTAFNGNVTNGQQSLLQTQQIPQQQLQAGTAQATTPQAFAPQNTAPANTTPVLSQSGVASSSNEPASTAPADSAQQSALQALGGFGPPQNAAVQSASEAPQTPQSTIAGAWTASLSNGARVQLSLQADGNFSWIAVNKEGQASTFQGTYTTENGSLSLSRSTDGQKLTGSLTPSGTNHFSFKLSDAQASSLDFVRS